MASEKEQSKIEKEQEQTKIEKTVSFSELIEIFEDELEEKAPTKGKLSGKELCTHLASVIDSIDREEYFYEKGILEALVSMFAAKRACIEFNNQLGVDIMNNSIVGMYESVQIACSSASEVIESVSKETRDGEDVSVSASDC